MNAGQTAMPINDPAALLHRSIQEAGEKPWAEFKENNRDPDLIAKTVCACANAAMLADKERAFVVCRSNLPFPINLG